MTKQRELILNIINQNDRHLTADEIYVLAKFKMPSIAMATVYNNLNALSDAGVIRRLHVGASADYFDKMTNAHDHAVCERCGRITNINLPSIMHMIESELGKEILDYDLVARYICPDCEKNRR